MGVRAVTAAVVALAACSVKTGSRVDDDVPPACGDGTLDQGEACDDGNTVDGDGCSASCASDESCGNGVLDPVAGEVCDDGNQGVGDGCSADCKSDETCGNGIIDDGEDCDDNNTVNGDNCPGDCKLAPVVYLIAAEQLINQASSCDGTGNNRFDGCGGAPTGFTWVDATPFIPGQVLVEFDNGINCFNVSSDATVCPGTPEGCSAQPDTRATTLNGIASGSFTTIPGNCFCEPANGVNPHNNNAVMLTDISSYVVGGTNTFLLAGAPPPTDPAVSRSNCFGFSNVLFAGSFARITVFP